MRGRSPQQIDRLLAAKWAEAKVRPARPADDAEFLRRVYLDLVGKIPTAAEARDFLDDPSPDKRGRLVEALLDSPAYLTHATETYRALLLARGRHRRPGPRPDADVRGLAPQEGRRGRRLRPDRPRGPDGPPGRARDAAGGNAHDPRAEPSPLAYYVAKEGKPENLAAGTARTFLGIRLECAQCHNHPFAQWKREQFWGLAAFFAGVSKQGKDDGLRPDPRGRRPPRADDPRHDARSSRPPSSTPSKPQWGRRATGRELLADWVTAPDNPYFARAAVNRVWARFFGTGLVDPVDDLRADNPPSHPELLDELARQFRSHGYDLKFLIRAITATQGLRPDQRASAARSRAPANLFAAMPVRALSPGQLFDSLAQATGFRDGPRQRHVRRRGVLAGPVPRAVHQPRREADRGRDVDPPGARA